MSVETPTQAPPKRITRRRPASRAQTTVQGCLAALAAHDLAAALACWAPDATAQIRGVGGLGVLVEANGQPSAPDQLRAALATLIDAVPDAVLDVEELLPSGSSCVVRWRLRGTYAGPGRLAMLEPDGAPIDGSGVAVLEVRDGLIRHAFVQLDGVTIARQLGILPTSSVRLARWSRSARNARVRAAGLLGGSAPARIADGVWLVRGGIAANGVNAYLIEDDDGVVAFDAGTRAMANSIAIAAARLGGLRRIVMSHAHADHRGGAARLGAPVSCHADARAEIEAADARPDLTAAALPLPLARLYPALLRAWDGGALPVASTLSAGESVAGFTVLHLPGHAAGLIALWRESDRLALASDSFVTADPWTGLPTRPRVPHAALNEDREQARASLRALAALDPAAAWPGRGNPVIGDVRARLERAADAA